MAEAGDRYISDYFSRQGVKMPDGSVSMASKRDRALEKAVQSALSFAWRCKVGSFGRFAPLDFYMMRDDKLVAVAELKTHPYEINRYPYTILNLRKYGWMALYKGLGVKVEYLKLFNEQLYYIDFDNIKVDQDIRMGGCHKWFKSCTDQEPVIKIPVEDMTWVMEVMPREKYDRLKELDELKSLPKPKPSTSYKRKKGQVYHNKVAAFHGGTK